MNLIMMMMMTMTTNTHNDIVLVVLVMMVVINSSTIYYVGFKVWLKNKIFLSEGINQGCQPTSESRYLVKDNFSDLDVLQMLR